MALGRRIAALALALALGTSARAAQPGDWSSRWDEAATLAELEPGSEAFGDLAARLLAVATSAGDDPRAGLLRRLVEQARGAEPAPASAAELALAEADWPLDRRESWLYARVAPTLTLRGRAAREALAREPELRIEREDLLTAWRTGADEARAFHFESALALQRELYDRYREPWSSMDLALTLSWADRADEAVSVLTETIEAEWRAGRPVADLYSRRGLVYLGIGEERRARDDLGRALAAGSTDAAVVLARLDLDRGARRAARVGFRSLLDVAAPGPWELRGWGLTLLGGTTPSTAGDATATTAARNTSTKRE